VCHGAHECCVVTVAVGSEIASAWVRATLSAIMPPRGRRVLDRESSSLSDLPEPKAKAKAKAKADPKAKAEPKAKAAPKEPKSKAEAKAKAAAKKAC
jgi:hypothetical protein